MIIELRNKIKEDLQKEFEDRMMDTYVFIASFPDSKDSLEQLQTEAKMYASKGVVYVTFTTERPGLKVNAVYPEYVLVFTVFIFSDNKATDDDIIEIYELCRDTLNKSLYLYVGEMSPIKNQATGMYMAYIQVGTSQIYQGES